MSVLILQKAQMESLGCNAIKNSKKFFLTNEQIKDIIAFDILDSIKIAEMCLIFYF